MIPPPLSKDEPARLQALRRTQLVETPLEERFERITRLAKRIFGVEIAAISLVEADRQWFKSIQGLTACETSRDESFCGHTILGSDIFIVPDAREDDRFRDNPLVTGPPHIVFYAACPLESSEGLLIGSLCLIDSKTRSFKDADRISLRDLAGVAEAELQSASGNAVQAALLEDLTAEHRRGLIDSLTRMWNREGILRLAEEALKNAKTGSVGCALVMVDLDHFKQINDTHGHAAGDEVLCAAARRMLAALRESDIVGRLGGDEFLLVLSPCDSVQSATAVAARVRQRIVATPIGTPSAKIPVTASIGVRFVAPGTEASLERLLEKTDAALYTSKRSGRDQVAVDGELVPTH